MELYDKARELGEMILETKEGKRFYDAKFVYNGDAEAQKVLAGYMHARNLLQSKAQTNSITEEEFQEELKKLQEIGKKTQENPIVDELLTAQDEFNQLVNTVLGILKETVVKDEENGGCSGSCSSCGGCH